MRAYVDRILRNSAGDAGYRLLIAGADREIDPSDEAMDIAAELSEAGGRVLLVDWSLDGKPLLSDVNVGRAGSIAELIADKAQFEDVLTPLADTNVQYAYASLTPNSAELSDARGVNLVLDACDEVYDQVIVFGRLDDATAIFETIEGRFDAGMLVAETSDDRDVVPDQFLGFDVTDIDIIHHSRSGRSRTAGVRRSGMAAR